MITREEFEPICRIICPLCAKEHDLRQRLDTKEWTHDTKKEGLVSHAVCWATNLRNSHYADVMNNG